MPINTSDLFGGGNSIVRRELFTADGTWTKPEGIIGEQVWVTMIGGGSSGNSCSSSRSLGGASGQYFIRQPVGVSADASVAITVGAGGASVNGGGTDTASNPGASSSFGTVLTALGGTAAANRAYYVGELNGGNWGNKDWGLDGSIAPPVISGDFGATPPYPDTVQMPHGASGLLLDDSGISGGNTGTLRGLVGGNGYGSGGSAANDNTVASGAGAPGAVLVEWLEKV